MATWDKKISILGSVACLSAHGEYIFCQTDRYYKVIILSLGHKILVQLAKKE